MATILVGAYIFTSEEMFGKRIKEAVDEAVEEALLAGVIERGRADRGGETHDANKW